MNNTEISESFGKLIVVIGVIFLISFPIMWIWNSCLVLACPFLVKITFWQAVGIKTLVSMLSPGTKTSE